MVGTTGLALLESGDTCLSVLRYIFCTYIFACTFMVDVGHGDLYFNDIGKDAF